MKKLIALKEFNKQREDDSSLNVLYPQLNGIECPLCKNELQDLDSLILCSIPPKRNVGCSKCSYRGYRIA